MIHYRSNLGLVLTLFFVTGTFSTPARATYGDRKCPLFFDIQGGSFAAASSDHAVKPERNIVDADIGFDNAPSRRKVNHKKVYDDEFEDRDTDDDFSSDDDDSDYGRGGRSQDDDDEPEDFNL